MTDVGWEVDDMMKWLEGDTQVEMGSKEKPSHGGKKGGNVTRTWAVAERS